MPLAASTTRGVAAIALEALTHVGIAPGADGGSTTRGRGFGEAGQGVTAFVARESARVVAVSDVNGGVHRGGGLDVAALERQVEEACMAIERVCQAHRVRGLYS
ncbi:hypothetical protein V6U90_25945 [Micromonospora sp. CPCC 206060]|uniref:hypothetical protein n=1 Tax=Micromonospora sp. CPCC 206060 TaxID=3122406 RepID=UPI002FEEC5AF